MTAESAIHQVLIKIELAWREKQFTGLEDCFHENAVIVGPNYDELASGQEKCAESYREFASNASVSNYSESSHHLRIWNETAIYTFEWEMTYHREDGPKREAGSDQIVLADTVSGWVVIWRYINFYNTN